MSSMPSAPSAKSFQKQTNKILLYHARTVSTTTVTKRYSFPSGEWFYSLPTRVSPILLTWKVGIELAVTGASKMNATFAFDGTTGSHPRCLRISDKPEQPRGWLASLSQNWLGSTYWSREKRSWQKWTIASFIFFPQPLTFIHLSFPCSFCISHLSEV